MAKAREIKKRITAVTKTKKITRTMEMVSTSRLKRYQNVVMSSRPYSEALTDVLGGLISSPAARAHPLMEKRDEVRSAAILLLSANRGLCGAFNNNLCRRTLDLYDELSDQGLETRLLVSGKKGISHFRHRGLELLWQDTGLPDDQSVNKVRELSNFLIEGFLSRKVDQVHVVYSRFVSAGRQVMTTEQLLPLAVETDAPEREAAQVDFIF
ncbi:MAG: F0F1 ATP synthase subunit gamma, partial [Gemmatimonadota bacterium]|nr:F0F1 ATP synthase subunit gamma [Gemmatimonadota bacterium]